MSGNKRTLDSLVTVTKKPFITSPSSEQTECEQFETDKSNLITVDPAQASNANLDEAIDIDSTNIDQNLIVIYSRPETHHNDIGYQLSQHNPPANDIKYLLLTKPFRPDNKYIFSNQRGKNGTVRRFMATWLIHRNATFTSSSVQNEIIELIHEYILSSVLGRVGPSTLYSIILDGTTDSSNVEQLCLLIRYVDPHSHEIHEAFLAFVPTTSSTGEAIANHILSSLKQYQLPLKNCIGQAYDDAPSMSGVFNGCQAIVKRSCPDAEYMRCSSHALNLFLIDSCTSRFIRNMFGIIKYVTTFFNDSAKRTNALKYEIERPHNDYLMLSKKKTSFVADSSPQVQDSKRHDINVRIQLAGHLTGIRHVGFQKICAALNLPPPLEEGRHNKRDKELLQVVQKFANESMSTAMQEAVDVAKSTDITVSGDGTWQTRDFSSKHGAADLLSTCDSPKVVDIETCSKTCNVCAGAKSLLQLGTPEARAKYDQTIINHNCGKNFDEPSGNMEASSILKMFRRSEKKYGVRYVKYIGDGDSKTFSVLKTEISYKGIQIQKIEDINHFGKRLKRALEVIKRKSGKEKLSDGKTIGGKGHLTDQMITRFQIYFCEAIRKNKNDLDKLYKSAQFSTSSDHHHQFCDEAWCGYLQAKKNNTRYNHTPHGLPRAVMNKTKPAFDSICSKQSLMRVLNGSTQNANEAFHALIWTMSPKHKAASDVTFNIACYLAVVVFSDGY
ncbi:unnamed protein product [Rotaria sp. Silwood2]|nr:unnamed protein product [Rotaria sp. Silwood2]